MKATHEFTIHAECPFVPHKQWDYYTVIIDTEEFIDVHAIEAALNEVRGARESQEKLAEAIRSKVGGNCSVMLRGSHSQGNLTTVVV